jgi:hypothetical protein
MPNLKHFFGCHSRTFRKGALLTAFGRMLHRFAGRTKIGLRRLYGCGEGLVVGHDSRVVVTRQQADDP